MKKKLFVIASRVPYPLDKGDKLRLYHQLRYLSNYYEVMLCALDGEKTSQKSIDHLKTIVAHVEIIKLAKWRIYLNLLFGLFGRKPFQIYYFYQKPAHKKVKQLIAAFAPDHIYCQLIRAAEYVKDNHSIKKTIDYQDAFSKGIERRIDAAGWKKRIFRMEFSRLLKYENIIFEYFDFHTIISTEDRNAIFHKSREQIVIVPNGIDSHFFTPKGRVEKTNDILFVGNMSYPPNVDAVVYISEKIMPILKAKNSDIKFLIAGSNPSPIVLKLKDANTEVTGWIDDIREAYESAKIFVAPMQIGTGLQNKLLEAMSMNLPCVTSNLANKSLGATHKENVLICNTPDTYAEAIDLLLTQQDLYTKLATNGKEFVGKKFSWGASVEQLKELLDN